MQAKVFCKHSKRTLYIVLCVSALLAVLIYVQKNSVKKINSTMAFYLEEKIVAQKIANPAPWAIKQINQDFSSYRDASRLNVLNTFDIVSTSNHAILFTIKDKKVSYRLSHANMHPTHLHALKVYTEVFAFIASNNYVNDVSFIIRLGDFFSNLESKQTMDLAPVLVFSKDTTKNLDKDAVLIPDYMNLDEMPTIYLQLDIAKQKYKWGNKDSKILWRGGTADSSGFRQQIVTYSATSGNSIVDAKFCDRLSTEKKDYMEPADHLKSKFMLSIDGSTATWTRPVWQLYSNSIMIKHDSNLIQWFYNAIEPEVHYIAINNINDLFQIRNKYSDSQLLAITKIAQEFAKNNLTINDMVAYLTLVLKKYHAMQHHTINS